MDKDTSGKNRTAGQMPQAGAIPAEGMAPEVEGHLQGQTMTPEGAAPEVAGHGQPFKGAEQPTAAQGLGPEPEGQAMPRP